MKKNKMTKTLAILLSLVMICSTLISPVVAADAADISQEQGQEVIQEIVPETQEEISEEVVQEAIQEPVQEEQTSIPEETSEETTVPAETTEEIPEDIPQEEITPQEAMEDSVWEEEEWSASWEFSQEAAANSELSMAPRLLRNARAASDFKITNLYYYYASAGVTIDSGKTAIEWEDLNGEKKNISYFISWQNDQVENIPVGDIKIDVTDLVKNGIPSPMKFGSWDLVQDSSSWYLQNNRIFTQDDAQVGQIKLSVSKDPTDYENGIHVSETIGVSMGGISTGQLDIPKLDVMVIREADTHVVNKEGRALTNLSALGEGAEDYYWVEWSLYGSIQDKKSVRGKTYILTDIIPSNVEIESINGKATTELNGLSVEVVPEGKKITYTSNVLQELTVVLKYPKVNYEENEQVSNTVNLQVEFDGYPNENHSATAQVNLQGAEDPIIPIPVGADSARIYSNIVLTYDGPELSPDMEIPVDVVKQQDYPFQVEMFGHSIQRNVEGGLIAHEATYHLDRLVAPCTSGRGTILTASGYEWDKVTVDESCFVYGVPSNSGEYIPYTGSYSVIYKVEGSEELTAGTFISTGNNIQSVELPKNTVEVKVVFHNIPSAMVVLQGGITVDATLKANRQHYGGSVGSSANRLAAVDRLIMTRSDDPSVNLLDGINTTTLWGSNSIQEVNSVTELSGTYIGGATIQLANHPRPAPSPAQWLDVDRYGENQVRGYSYKTFHTSQRSYYLYNCGYSNNGYPSGGAKTVLASGNWSNNEGDEYFRLPAGTNLDYVANSSSWQKHLGFGITRNTGTFMNHFTVRYIMPFGVTLDGTPQVGSMAVTLNAGKVKDYMDFTTQDIVIDGYTYQAVDIEFDFRSVGVRSWWPRRNVDCNGFAVQIPAKILKTTYYDYQSSYSKSGNEARFHAIGLLYCHDEEDLGNALDSSSYYDSDIKGFAPWDGQTEIDLAGDMAPVMREESTDWKDLNRDGVTENKVVPIKQFITLDFPDSSAATQGAYKSVLTSSTSEFSRATEETPVQVATDETYRYLLRANYGEAGACRGVTFTDILENEGSDWQGIFESVDVSYASSQGANPKVYYSNSNSPSVDSNGNAVLGDATWQPLPDNPTKEFKQSIKAIAVDLTKKVDGNEMQFPYGTQVEILMKAPDKRNGISSPYLAKNTFTTTAIALEEEQPVLSTNTTNVLLTGRNDFGIRKVDSVGESTYLSGASFKLTSANGTFYTDTSDALGEVFFKNLPYGVYTLEETISPEGYETYTGSWTVTVDDRVTMTSSEEPGITITATDDATYGIPFFVIKNTKLNYGLSGTLWVDNNLNNSIEGTGLYEGEERRLAATTRYASGTVSSSTGVQYYVYLLDENGKRVYDVDGKLVERSEPETNTGEYAFERLLPGTYYVYADIYEISGFTTPYTITPLNRAQIVDYPEDDGTPEGASTAAPGTKMALLDNIEIVDAGVSNQNIGVVPPYTITKTAKVTPKGGVQQAASTGTTDLPVEVEVGDTITYEISVTVTVPTFNSGKKVTRDAIVGATIADDIPQGLTLATPPNYNPSGGTSSTTGGATTVSWTGQRIGSTEPPTTYSFDVTVDELGSLPGRTFVNKAKITTINSEKESNETYHKVGTDGYPFRFLKVKEDNTTGLSGATFQLYKYDAATSTRGELVDTQISKSEDSANSIPEGLVEFTTLVPGTYELIESEAPSGYIRPYGSWIITLAADGAITITALTGSTVPAFSNISGVTEDAPAYKVMNRLDTPLPLLGSKTIRWLSLLGLLLAAVAGGILLLRKRRINIKSTTQPVKKGKKNMKKTNLFKKIAAIALAGTMLLGMTTSAFAEQAFPNNTTETGGTIYVHKYLRTDASSSTGNGTEIADTTTFGTPLANAGFTVYRATSTTVDLAAINTKELVDAAVTAGEIEAAEAEKMTSSDGSATFSSLPLGSYLVVETTTPAVVTTPSAPYVVNIPMPDPTAPTNWLYNVHTYPKNLYTPGDTPTPGKDINTGAAGTYDPSQVTDSKGFKVGDEIPFVLKGTIPTDIAGYTKYNLVDTMGVGLEVSTGAALNNGVASVKAYKVTGVTATEEVVLTTDDYTVSKTDQVVTISLTPEGIAKLATAKAAGATHVIADFRAKITADAAMGTDIENNITLNYTNTTGTDGTSTPQQGDPDPKVYTGGFNIIKQDVNTKAALEGATFAVFTNIACTTPAMNAAGTPITGISDADGKISFSGLAYGTAGQDAVAGSTNYYVKETSAPAGYVTLGQVITVTVNATSHIVTSGTPGNEVVVYNAKTPSLPNTGGVGTIIFTLLGLALIAVAGGGLFFLRRKTTR